MSKLGVPIPPPPSLRVAGIDVGGNKKGCHLVVLRGVEIICNMATRDPEELARLCRDNEVQLVGVDSPCKWSATGAGRKAERSLAKERIFSFATPTRARAVENQSGFYRWMFNGEKVYSALSGAYPLLTGSKYSGGCHCFETFPHAVTCSFLGREVASAKKKKLQRRSILANAGIDIGVLKSIDAVDAALCALTAVYLYCGKTQAYGDDEDGYIFVPCPATP